MSDIETETSKTAPEHSVFVRPAWGLTYAIPEGTMLAWGARAIYSWRSMTKPVTTKTGKVKILRGERLTSTTYEPVIDLLGDRMGWSSFGIEQPRIERQLHGEGPIARTDVEKAAMHAMGAWIDSTGLPAIKAACRKRQIQTFDDGPAALVEHTSDGYTIVANPNGSHGYLYIAAWRHVS